MFLKRIEINGFKSFADEVKLDFEPAITGIIGPNGSGKSNISDAIKWVLGEQSAKSLRGGKMEDVIFAGSDKRRSLGMAEVSLTLDNSQGDLPIDYNQVTITRRVTRSGESDYLINNNLCRLKDIKELFMDTGVGKESYSIIGQGKVKTILSERATERRELFEEAAGIGKHKMRKQKAVNKLENTKQKLQRIEDIISEIERQLGPLKKESKKAKEYKTYKTELEEIEVNLLLNKYADLDYQLKQMKNNKEKLSYKLTEAKSAVSEYDLKIDNHKEELKKLTNLLDQQKDEIFEAKSNVERVENKLELAQQKKQNLFDRENRLQNEISKLENKIILKEEKISAKEEKINKLEELIRDKEFVLKKQEKDLNNINQQLENKLADKEEVRNNQLQQINKINNQKHQLETITKDINRYQKELSELKENESKLDHNLQQVKDKKEVIDKKLTTIRKKIADYKNEYSQKVELKQKEQNKLHKLQDQYQNLKDKINNKKSRLNILEGMEENYKGYYRGVRNLLKKANKTDRMSGVCGVVAELLETPKKYEAAIEVALGSKLQNIVVENDKVGQRAINYLKKNKAGRATFLPLNLVTSRSLRNSEKKALDVTGAIGVAQNLVEFSSKYKPVIANMLGRVIVAQDIESAVKISKAANKRIKVVTLEGEIVNPGGSMTGGSRNQNNSLLGRSREIKELSSTVSKSTNKLEKLEEEGLQYKESLLETEDDLKKLNNNIHSLEIKETNYKKDYQQAENELNRLDLELQDKNDQVNELKDEITSLNEQKTELTNKLGKLATDEGDLKGVIGSIEEQITMFEEQKEKYNNKITDLKVEIASLKQEQESLKEETKREKESITINKEEINSKKREVKQLEAKRVELKKTKKELNDKQKLLSDKVKKLKGELDNLRQKKGDINNKIRKYQQESEDIRNKFENLQEKYNQLEVEIAQLEVKLDNVEEKLTQEYELNIEQIINQREELESYGQVEQRISELKKIMKQLEPVNLGSIEEYETLDHRFQFLQEQYQDLVKARESLQKVINEINIKMEEKFSSTFVKIKQNFEEIFQDLFGGGEAELTLEDKDDLLKTGIEINAQPPGKKLQKLSLMSGGEKALTATALIFALLKVNPSPFYVLDELDAPLDDANVNRFANYLNKLSSIAQFIVITHRKKTMEAVDTLYGVTMQESGVSKLVSLKLSELSKF